MISLEFQETAASISVCHPVDNAGQGWGGKCLKLIPELASRSNCMGNWVCHLQTDVLPTLF